MIWANLILLGVHFLRKDCNGAHISKSLPVRFQKEYDKIKEL